MKNKKPRWKKRDVKPIISGLILAILFCLVAFGTYALLSVQSDSAKAAAASAKAAAIEAKKEEPVYITLPGAKTIRAIVSDYTKPDSLWVIVNKTHPIPITYVPPNLKVPNVPIRTDKTKLEMSLRSIVGVPLAVMFKAAAAAGHDLMIGSGYRSAAIQESYFDTLAATAGEVAANDAIADPGQSEHQTGLALDINSYSQSCYLDQCSLAATDAQWLADNSYKYGFILRYPPGDESITGYQSEPWHFRYVGVALATALHESNMTLDQAWPYLQKADATLHDNGAI
jgi:LAS superfamily LD-carboxypeptidase LdcB